MKLSAFGLIVGLVLGGGVTALAQTSSTNASLYIQRLGIVATDARAAVHYFFDTLEGAGLASNLLDVAFLDARSQPGAGLLSWSNSIATVGPIARLPAGLMVNGDGLQTNSCFFVTNLPATPDSRTVVFWYHAFYDGNIAGNLESPIVGLACAGSGWVDGCSMYCEAVTDFKVISVRDGGNVGRTDTLGPRINNVNLACIAMASSSTGTMGAWFTPSARIYSTQTAQGVGPGSPAIAIFGADIWGRTNPSACGVYRAFAIFNKVLSSNEVAMVDAALPRTGVIFEGDSKTAGNASWPTFFLQSTQHCGLVQMLTNSAVAGTWLGGAGDTMEGRWPGDSAFVPSGMYPAMIYCLRGGLHDINDTTNPNKVPTLINNASNLIVAARSAGMKTAIFTLEPTYIDTSNAVPVAQFNAWVRTNGLSTWVVDADAYYESQWGAFCWTNSLIFGDGIHETAVGYRLLGSNCVASAISEPLFQAPSPQITGVNLSGTTLSMAAINGAAGGSWTLLQSADVTVPLERWTTLTSGTFDGSGQLFTNLLNVATNSRQFFVLRVQ